MCDLILVTQFTFNPFNYMGFRDKQTEGIPRLTSIKNVGKDKR